MGEGEEGEEEDKNFPRMNASIATSAIYKLREIENRNEMRERTWMRLKEEVEEEGG